MANVTICPSTCTREILYESLHASHGFWFFLGTDYSVLKELRSTIGNAITEIVSDDEFSITAEQLRQPFADYINFLVKHSVKSHEKYSGFFENSPFKSNIFQNICFIKLVQKILLKYPDSSILIICQDRTVTADLYRTLAADPDNCTRIVMRGTAIPAVKKISSGLKAVARAGHMTLVLLARKIMSPGIRGKNTSWPDQREDLICIHSWMSTSSAARKNYHDMFFYDLQEKLENMGYKTILIPHIPFDVSYSACMQILSDSPGSFVTEESLLSIPAIITVFISCILDYPRKKDYSFEGISISESVYGQEFEDWRSLQLSMPLTWECIIDQLSAEKIKIRSFILLHENYLYERAILSSFHRLFPKTTLIGYQHSAVTKNHLSFSLPTQGLDDIELPDIIITNGKYPRDFFLSRGYPEERIIIGGALRYAEILRSSSPQKTQVQKRNVILLTLPGILDESREILEKIHEAGINPSIRILCKAHPFISKDLLKNTGNPDQGSIEFTNESLNTLLPGAAVLLYSNTSTCIEALSLEIPVLRICSERRLDMDPLSDFQGTNPYIRTATKPSEIRDILSQILEYQFTDEDRSGIQRIVHDILGDITEQTYKAFTLIKK
jgi:hypothetical protein